MFTALLFAMVLGAQPDLPGRATELLARLNSADLSTRDAAQAEIALDPAWTLVRIAELLRTPELSGEQRERLLTAGRQLFLREPRGAMGVQFSVGAFMEDGATVGGTLPDFDSSRVLRAGDVIRTLDGQAVYGNDDVREIIVSHDPGESVSVGLVRAGRAMQIRVHLGRYEDLRDGKRPSLDTVDAAWRRRAERLGAASRPAPPLEPGVTRFTNDRSVAQAREGYRALDASRQAELAAAGLDTGWRPTGVVSGGEPRGGIWSSMAEYRPSQPNPNAFDARPRDPLQDRQTLLIELQTCRNQIAAVEQALRNPAHDAAHLPELRTKLAQLSAQENFLRARIRELDRVAGAEP